MRVGGYVILALAAIGPGAQLQAPPSAQLSLHQSAMVHLTDAEAEWVKTHPEVHWGIDPHWPPFSYLDHQGEWAGIDVELTRLAAKRAGLRVVLVPTSSWTETLNRARTGEIDFLSATAKTPERLAEFDYTQEYASFPVVIITRKDAPFVISIHSLGSARIAGPRDHVTSEQLHRDFPKANLRLTDSTEEALLMVSTGQADAMIANLAVAGYLLSIRGLANLKISGITGYEFPLRFAIRKDAPLLTSILSKGLATIIPAEQGIISAKYLHPELGKGRDWGVWRRRALYAALIGAGISATFLIWNRTMAQRIRHCKTMEAALREARDKLEQRTRQLDRRVDDVERLNQQLVAANKDLDSFSASVSHDLRAPLRRVNSFVNLLQKQIGDRSKPELQEYSSIIDQETRRMSQLIDDLLAFARVGRDTIHEVPVDMDQLVRQTVKEFSLEFHGRDIDWHIGALPEVTGDRNLLRQVLSNLIDNALKFTRRRARAEIRIDVVLPQPDDKEIVFYVQDNGCGFDMKHAKSLFGAFRRLHGDAEFEGTGIGLANVQRIIQRHGGRVWAEGVVDQGATFWFSLPRRSASCS